MKKFQNCIRVALGLSILHFLLTEIKAKKRTTPSPDDRRWFEPIVKRGRQEGDHKSLPFRKVSQLYSRNSGKHVRVLPNRSVDALGADGDKYAKLIVESAGFGSVRIRGAETKLYICVDKKRRLRGRNKGRGKRNCVWKDIFADNGYTEYRSARYSNILLAFKRNGKQKRGNSGKKTLTGMNSVQFVVRPWKERLRLYMGRRARMNNKKLVKKIQKYLTLDQWRKWRRWLKEKRRKKIERKNRKLLPTEETTQRSRSPSPTQNTRYSATSAQNTTNLFKSRS